MSRNSPMDCLPKDLKRKIKKTSQTRGAQPYSRVVYQNRVSRSNKVVIPFQFRDHIYPGGFDNDYSVLVRPGDYFDPSTKEVREDFPKNIHIGKNQAFIYYDNRKAWRDFPPLPHWKPRKHLIDGKAFDGQEKGFKRDLHGVDQGEYIARVPGLTGRGENAAPIIEGPPQGIRFFEFTPQEELKKIELQLAYLCTLSQGFDNKETDSYKKLIEEVEKHKLNDHERLQEKGILSKDNKLICPLCREPLSLNELTEQVEQMEGREVVDLTITKVNLFHIKEIRPGEFNHCTYNLGWGHHHCNAIVRDTGIQETLQWMKKVLSNNEMN